MSLDEEGIGHSNTIKDSNEKGHRLNEILGQRVKDDRTNIDEGDLQIVTNERRGRIGNYW